MIDWNQTRQFNEFCSSVSRFSKGDNRFRADIEDKRSSAQRHLTEMAQDTAELAIDYADIQRCFDEREIRRIRLDEPLERETFEKLFVLTAKMASQFHEMHPNANRWPTRTEWPNTLLYRIALLQHLHFFDWIRNGSPSHLNAEKIRNDIVDLNYAAYATFFDGLMTNDQKLNGLYQEARHLIDEFIVPMSRGRD